MFWRELQEVQQLNPGDCSQSPSCLHLLFCCRFMELRSWDLQGTYQSPSSPPASLASAGPHQSGQVCWSFLKSKLKTKLLSELAEWVSSPFQPIELGTQRETRKQTGGIWNHHLLESWEMPRGRVRAGIRAVLVALPVLVEHLQGSCSRTSTAGAAPLPHRLIHQFYQSLQVSLNYKTLLYQKLNKEIAESSNICQAQQHLP